MRPLPEGLEDAARHLLPVAAELSEAAAELTQGERAAVGGYLEAATEISRRPARGARTAGACTHGGRRRRAETARGRRVPPDGR